MSRLAFSQFLLRQSQRPRPARVSHYQAKGGRVMRKLVVLAFLAAVMVDSGSIAAARIIARQRRTNRKEEGVSSTVSTLGRGKKLSLLALVVAATFAVSATTASADYGRGAAYQIELSVNSSGSQGGGIWLWIGLNADGTGDYAGSDCGHGGAGTASDKGDVTWHYSGDNVVIEGVALNALPNSIVPFVPPPYQTTITVPKAYGHYTGNDHAFLTLPGFLPVGGFSQLQVAR